MKILPFLILTSAALYSSMRWDLVANILIGAFATGALSMIYISIYRHLRANRYF